MSINLLAFFNIAQTYVFISPLYLENPLMRTVTNREYPDKMQHKATFH